MTKKLHGYTVYEYDEWKRLPHIAKWLEKRQAEAESETCDICSGSGRHECECGDIHSCAACDGTGTYSDFDPRLAYERELRGEIERLRKYVGYG